MSQFCPFHVVTIGNVAGFVECVREDCMAWMDGGCIRLTALMPLIVDSRQDTSRPATRGLDKIIAAYREKQK